MKMKVLSIIYAHPIFKKKHIGAVGENNNNKEFTFQETYKPCQR